MADLRLSLACWDYDRTRALFDGRVKLNGVDLRMSTTHRVGEIMRRMMLDREFDACEIGLTYYFRSLEFLGAPFIAIPVFPNRFFRHSAIFVNANSGLSSPRDLVGKRVGELARYGHDAGVWAKGAMSDDFGLKVEQYSHVIGEMDGAAPSPDWAPFAPPRGVDISYIKQGQSLNHMLATGEIDALIGAHAPQGARDGSGNIRRLFADCEAVERDWFKRTGVFPIMHTVVIRRDVYEKNRWIAAELFRAFDEARKLAMQTYAASDIFFNAPVMIPFFSHLRERNRELMGDDFWPYGLERNRKTLETFLRYHREQGILKMPLAVDELFAPETLA